MPTVLIYRRNLLPFSETFIYRQVQSLKNWDAILVGEKLQDGIPLEGLNCQFIDLPDPSKGVPVNPLLDSLRRRLRIARSRQPSPLFQANTTAKYIKRQKWFSYLREQSPKLLHVHFGTNAEEAWPLALALDIPMLVTLHGYDAATYPDWWESGRGGRRYKGYPAALRAMEQSGAKFVAVSDAIAESGLGYGLGAQSIRKILIGIDTRAIAVGHIPISSRANRVLFVGRFVEKKGIEFLIRAFAQVRRNVPDAELRLVGEGALESDLRRLANGSGVQFLGRLTSHQVIEEMHMAKVLCVPSIRARSGDSEGLPTVIMEAQAAGLPVVTSARGGTSEGIIDGVTGIAFPERDEEAMARSLSLFLTDDVMASHASMAARKFAEEKLEADVHTAALEQYYNEIVNSGGVR